MFLILALSIAFDPVPTFTVVNKCPPKFVVVMKSVSAQQTKLARVTDLNWHVHKCPLCLTEWSHPDTSAGDVAKHTCPSCKTVLPRPWFPDQRNIRIVEVVVKDPYAEVLRRVKAGEALTVAVGVSDAADVHLDKVPDTTPGLWRCYLRDGESVMEPVPRTVMPSRFYPPSLRNK